MEHFPPPHPLPGRVSGMHSSCMHGGVWSGGASRKWSGPADVSCHRRLLAQTENPRDGLRKGGRGKKDVVSRRSLLIFLDFHGVRAGVCVIREM